jgi:predicted DNA-binding transcriptional regulator AlpA
VHREVSPTMTTDRDRQRQREHLKIADICSELGVARSTFYDWRAKKTAPRCIKLPNGELRVRRSDFDAWLASRLESEP